MDTKTDPPGPPRAMVPTFRQPPPPEPEPIPAPETAGAENLFRPAEDSPNRPALGRLFAQSEHGDGTRTDTSASPGSKPKHADITVLVAAVLGLLVLVPVAYINWRSRGTLAFRKPTEHQTKDVASPVARILMRHIDLSKLPADLGDVLAAGAAVGVYVNDGPLIEVTGRYTEIPDDLQGEDA